MPTKENSSLPLLISPRLALHKDNWFLLFVSLISY